MSSWWLTEEAAPDFGAVEVAQPDVEIVGAGITGISAALTFAEAGKARSRPRRAPRRRRRERAQRRLRAARRRDAVRPRARHRSAPNAPRSYWRLTEEHLDRLAAARRRRAPTDRQPPSRRGRCGTRRDPRRVRGARRGRLRGGVGSRTASAVAFPRRSFIRATRPPSRRGSFGDSRCSRRKPASRSSSTIASIRSTSSTPSRCSSRRTATRAACSVRSRELIVPTRGQVIATEPIRRASVPVPALRPPRIRLLAADTRRPDRRRRLPRRRARVGVHGGGADHAGDPGRARQVRRGARRTSDPDLASLGRHLRIGARLATARRARAGLGSRVGRSRLLGPRQRARIRLRRCSSRRRCSATSIRCSACSTLFGSGSGAQASTSKR